MTGQATGQIKSLVAGNIDSAIERSDLTAGEIARRLGTGEKAIYRWRKGMITPSQKNMHRLAHLLTDGDVAWFYTDHSEVEAA